MSYRGAPDGILGEVAIEHARQYVRWREQNHPDGTGPRVPIAGRLCYAEDAAYEARLDCHRAAREGKTTWLKILREEVYEAFAEDDPTKLRDELIQVAVVAVSWIEAIDRRSV